MITLIYMNTPFTKTEPLVFERIDKGDVTIRSLLEHIPESHKQDGDFLLPTICKVNTDLTDNYALRKDWDKPLPENAIVTFVSYPRGLEISFATIFASFLVSSAISFVLYIFLPKPELTGSQTRPETSPTYDTGDPSNRRRLGQAQPVQYGRVLSYPDQAARYYTEFAGNDQILYAFFQISRGAMQIERVNIGDTIIDVFDDVQYNILPPGTRPTLYPNLVDTVPEVGNRVLTADFTPIFTATPLGTTTSQLGIDLAFPRGLGTLQNNGSITEAFIGLDIEYRRRLSNGTTTQWFNVLNPLITTPIPIDDFPTFINTQVPQLEVGSVISGATNQPMRITLIIDVPDITGARYEVRLRRFQNEDSNAQIVSRCQWVGLRSYSTDSHPDYGDGTYLEMRIKASNQLNNDNIGIVNVLGTRMIREWEPGTGFTNLRPSRSIIWGMVDAALNDDYGAGLPATIFNYERLHVIAQEHQSRGDTFDARFETTSNFMEALQQFARVGRCIVYPRAGGLEVERDQPQTIPVVKYNPFNCEVVNISWTPRSRYSPNYALSTYLDETTWQEESVSSVLPGDQEVTANNLQWFGAVNRAQVWREAMFTMAVDRYRRRRITLRTDAEGMVPRLGQLVTVPLTRMNVGQYGQVLKVDGGVIYTDEPINFGGAFEGLVRFRDSRGKPTQVFQCSAGPTPYSFTIVGGLSGVQLTALDDQTTKEPSTYEFRTLFEKTTEGIVSSINVIDSNRFELEIVKENPIVHTVDAGIPPALPDSFALEQPRILRDAEVIIATLGGRIFVSGSWTGVGYQAYRVRISTDGTNFISFRTPERQFTIEQAIDAAVPTVVRITPVDIIGGSFVDINSATIEATITTNVVSGEIENFQYIIYPADESAGDIEFTWALYTGPENILFRIYKQSDTSFSNALVSQTLNPGTVRTIAGIDLPGGLADTDRVLVARIRPDNPSKTWQEVIINDPPPPPVANFRLNELRFATPGNYDNIFIEVAWNRYSTSDVNVERIDIYAEPGGVNGTNENFVISTSNRVFTTRDLDRTSASFIYNLGAANLPNVMHIKIAVFDEIGVGGIQLMNIRI